MTSETVAGLRSRRSFMKGVVLGSGAIVTLGTGGVIVRDVITTSEAAWVVLTDLAHALGISVAVDAIKDLGKRGIRELTSIAPDGSKVLYTPDKHGFGFSQDLRALSATPAHASGYSKLIYLVTADNYLIDLLPRAAQALRVVANELGSAAEATIFPLARADAHGSHAYAESRRVNWLASRGPVAVVHEVHPSGAEFEVVQVASVGEWAFRVAPDGVNLSSLRPVRRPK